MTPIPHSLLCDPELIDVVDDVVDELPCDEALSTRPMEEMDADFSLAGQDEEPAGWTEMGELASR